MAEASGHPRGICFSGELCSFPSLELNPSHPCSSCNEIVHTLCARDIIVDGHGGYQVCFKYSELKHQAELVSEVQQAHDEDVAMDEQQEEYGIIAALAPLVLMPIPCKPIGLEAATSAVGGGAVHQYVITPSRHGCVFRITTPRPSSDATPTATSTGVTSTRGRATKRTAEVLPTTTSRKKTQKTAQKIKKGVRIKITRDRLYHICALDQQARLPTSSGNSYNVYGTVIQGSSGKRGWDVQFDVSPLENHTVKNVSRNKIVVLSDDDVGVEYNREVDLSDHPSTFVSPTQTEKQKNPKRSSSLWMMTTHPTPVLSSISGAKQLPRRWTGRSWQMMKKSILECQTLKVTRQHQRSTSMMKLTRVTSFSNSSSLRSRDMNRSLMPTFRMTKPIFMKL
jgi:hypothetical protein